MEPDGKVLKFTKVLSEMDEALLSTLHPRKTKVIFVNIFNHSMEFMKRILVYFRGTCSLGCENFN